VAAADFNGDGHVDLALGLNASTLAVLLNDGTGAFSAATTYPTGTFMRAVHAADLNGDGHVDLVASGDEGLGVLLGRGNGTFRPPVGYPFSSGTSDAGVADFNADGRPDVANAVGSGSVGILLALPATAPTTTIDLTPADNSVNGWYVFVPHVTVSAADNPGGSGLAEMRCVLDPVSVPAAFANLPAGCAFAGAGADVASDAVHTVYAASVDNAGNAGPVIAKTFREDRTPPIVVCETPAPAFPLGQLLARVTVAVSDLTSGPNPIFPPTNFALADTGSPGTKVVTVRGNDVAGNYATVACPYTVIDPNDRDGDGMSNEIETRFGLDPDDATGDNGAGGDPDHDGLINVLEIALQSHPRGFYSQHFAEGAIGFFQTTVGMVNASPTDSAHVLVSMFADTPGINSLLWFTLNPLERRTVDVNAEFGRYWAGVGVSTRVESDQPIAATRDMRWGDPVYGSTLERGAPAASTTWYFAEGATGVFNEYLLIENPNFEAATVTIDYLRAAGAPIAQTIEIPGLARQTIDVKSVPGLASAEVAAVVSSDLPVVAERSMYVSFSNRLFDAGTAGLGATSLSTTWHFAEGATGFFETFLLLGNPGGSDAHVSVDYRLSNGTSIPKTYTVPARARRTISVAFEDPALAAATFSTTVSSDQPIVAERAM
jgi:hypothetical protein